MHNPVPGIFDRHIRLDDIIERSSIAYGPPRLQLGVPDGHGWFRVITVELDEIFADSWRDLDWREAYLARYLAEYATDAPHADGLGEAVAAVDGATDILCGEWAEAVLPAGPANCAYDVPLRTVEALPPTACIVVNRAALRLYCHDGSSPGTLWRRLVVHEYDRHIRGVDITEGSE